MSGGLSIAHMDSHPCLSRSHFWRGGVLPRPGLRLHFYKSGCEGVTCALIFWDCVEDFVEKVFVFFIVL